jgi:hypothetical protein
VKVKYYFNVLRYVYDPVTQEFVNIGVVVYAPQRGFLKAICTSHYSRVSKMFHRIDGASFRSLVRYIQDSISSVSKDWDKGSLFADPDEKLEKILGRILPVDDSAIRFATGGVGLTERPEQTLQELYQRYVARYEQAADSFGRDDEEVWRVFKKPLEQRNIVDRLVPKRIVAQNYEYQFERSWKNGVWHVYEPVSFDLVDTGSILDKANRWLGRVTSLMDSAESFKLYLLLGEPRDQRLQAAFRKAENILAKMPGQREFVREQEAEDFAEEVEFEIKEHLVTEG